MFVKLLLRNREAEGRETFGGDYGGPRKRFGQGRRGPRPLLIFGLFEHLDARVSLNTVGCF